MARAQPVAQEVKHWPVNSISRHASTLMAVVAFALLSMATAGSAERLTVGVLKFGTVNWQLRTVKDNGFDTAAGVDLEILPLASKNATSVALQSGAADMIVTDWIWALRQRAEGEDFVFAPYTNALGALVLTKGTGFSGISALNGKRIGIAGGPLDKSWLILRASSLRKHGTDLADTAEAVFGAPPLLSEQLRQGGLDAVLTFWPYAARLKAADHVVALNVEDMLGDLGVDHPPSLVGYVFRKSFERKSPGLIKGFFQALSQANAVLKTDDSAWDAIRPLMKAANNSEFAALKAGFRAGIPSTVFVQDTSGAEQLFDIMRDMGGAKLLGKAQTFDPALFWRPDNASTQ